jgi:hypothetical protein
MRSNRGGRSPSTPHDLVLEGICTPRLCKRLNTRSFQISQISQICRVNRPPSELIYIKARHRVVHQRRADKSGPPSSQIVFTISTGNGAHFVRCAVIRLFDPHRLLTTVPTSTGAFISLPLSKQKGLMQGVRKDTKQAPMGTKHGPAQTGILCGLCGFDRCYL